MTPQRKHDLEEALLTLSKASYFAGIPASTINRMLTAYTTLVRNGIKEINHNERSMVACREKRNGSQSHPRRPR